MFGTATSSPLETTIKHLPKPESRKFGMIQEGLCLGFRVGGLRFRVWGLGLRVWGSGFRFSRVYLPAQPQNISSRPLVEASPEPGQCRCPKQLGWVVGVDPTMVLKSALRQQLSKSFGLLQEGLLKSRIPWGGWSLQPWLLLVPRCDPNLLKVYTEIPSLW